MKNSIRMRISFIQIVGLVLYVFWAMGDPNISIWHWIAPLALDWADQIVNNILNQK